MGWTLLMPVVLFFQGMLNALRFSTMNTLTLKTLPDRLASSGNSLLSMAMQLSMSIGVSTAGILLGTLPALIFNRVPPDTGANRHLAR